MESLEIKDLKHAYIDGGSKNYVLKGINAEFQPGKFYAILGESGSGKTTLLFLISALDTVQEGKILYDGENVKNIGNTKFRLKYVNVIFQSYNLINYMTARENIEVAIDLMIEKSKRKNKKEEAYKILEKVGIDREKADRRVLKLSGGEQQRTAIARSLVGDVPIITADEPTGNLDEENEDNIIEIFKKLAEQGKCVIVVTHSKNIADKADIQYVIKKGIISEKKVV